MVAFEMERVMMRRVALRREDGTGVRLARHVVKSDGFGARRACA
jgi:hypothetical protein